MAELQTFPLHWSRGEALSQVSGVIEIEEPLAVGDKVVFEVDHSADVVFAFAELPRFEAAAGLVIRPLLDGLTGGGFRVEVECVEEVAYQPSELSWTRYGVKE